MTDPERRQIIYDKCYWDGENLGVVAQAMLLKAEWQRRFLEEINPNVIIHMDEPYLTQIGSSFISVSNPDELLRKQFEALKKNRGAHCCGQTEYAMLFHSPLDIVSLDLTGDNWDGTWDSANFAQAFVASAPHAGVKEFLTKGGIIALGTVPYNSTVKPELVRDHTLTVFAELEGRGVDIASHIKQFFITPTCGAGSQSPEVASHAFSSSVLVAKQLQEWARHPGGELR